MDINIDMDNKCIRIDGELYHLSKQPSTNPTVAENKEHKCKYCGAMTTQHDELCYANPDYKEPAWWKGQLEQAYQNWKKSSEDYFSVTHDLLAKKYNWKTVTPTKSDDIKAILTTEDGIEKFKGDNVYYVSKDRLSFLRPCETFVGLVSLENLSEFTIRRINFGDFYFFDKPKSATDFIANNRKSISYQELKNFVDANKDWNFGDLLINFKPK